MSKFKLLPDARADMTEIAIYTQETWGREQRDSYIRQINNRFAELAETPLSGLARDDLHEGLRSAKEGKHVIFYVRTQDGIEVVRVLHERRNIERQIDRERDSLEREDIQRTR